MSAKTEEFEGRALEERQRWGETVLRSVAVEGEVRPITVKTSAEPGEIVEGLTYRWLGRWVTHYKYGRQFQASSYTRVRPSDQKGILVYLQRAPHVGPATADALWRTYGADAVRRLREDPDAVAAALNRKGFSQTRARIAAHFLEEEAALEASTIEVLDLLSGKGFPRKTVGRVLQAWGARAGELIRRNPYLLMRFPGAGFLRTDALYLERGGRPDRLKRQTLCAWHSITKDSDGHTWFRPDYIEQALRTRIGSAEVDPVAAVRLGLRARLLAIHRNGDAMPWITEAGRSLAEQRVADAVAFMESRPAAWPTTEGLEVSEHQRQALAAALRSPVGVLAGSPGTGKTFTAARLIARLIGEHGQDEVAVVAPTGKAAVRISEALQSYGVVLRARTIHSFLGVLQAADGLRDKYHATQALGSPGWCFEHCQGNPVDQRFIVVDESSMVDVELMAAFLDALPPDGHVLLVGDVQQLPPVGHGAPLRDLLAAGVAQGELREIRRNSGAIVETCARIRDQDGFDLGTVLEPETGRNLILREAATGEDAQDWILRLVRNIRDLHLADPVWETQVLVAVNDKGPLSRRELNRLLQEELNGGNRSAGARFWVGDKIVCLKNSFMPAVSEVMDSLEEDLDEGYTRGREDGSTDLYVANGELGRVLEDFPNRLVVEFSAPKRVVLIPKKGGGEAATEEGGAGGEGSVVDFDLGYTVSCHKSQGSEWPIVIVALDDGGGARLVCDRAWLYTAISRAKRAAILVGKEATARAMVRTQKIGWRKTLLVERLAAAREQHAAAERLVKELESHDAQTEGKEVKPIEEPSQT